MFLWSGASGVFFVFSFFISAIFLLRISEGYSRGTVIAQGVSVLFTVFCTRAIWFSVLQPAIASGLIEARRIILIADPSHCSQFPLEQAPPEFGASARSTRLGHLLRHTNIDELPPCRQLAAPASARSRATCTYQPRLICIVICRPRD